VSVLDKNGLRVLNVKELRDHFVDKFGLHLGHFMTVFQLLFCEEVVVKVVGLGQDGGNAMDGSFVKAFV
jgi:hypothetical protein